MDHRSYEVLDQEIEKVFPLMVEVRRHLHQHPDLSGQEEETSRYLSERLRDQGIELQVLPDGRGIITNDLPAQRPITVALRADMDALPIHEENAVDYRSTRGGVMHACGHDSHCAMLLGTLVALHRLGQLPVQVRGLFQPSEEVGNGAQHLIREGALRGVDAILALHVSPVLELGYANLTPGPRTAFCQDFQILVRGRGGHGARPHLTIDPIATACQLVTLIHQIVPRRNDARAPLVITIGQIRGGNAANVIPDQVILHGTIRALRKEIALDALATLRTVCTGCALASGAEIDLRPSNLLNGLANNEEIAHRLLPVLEKLCGAGKVVHDDPPSMGGEDFADYAAVVPACMILVGVRPAGAPIAHLHTATFNLDETALLSGARILGHAILSWPTQTE